MTEPSSHRWLFHWPVLTAAEAAEVDARTIEGLGMPGPVLMESAGRACWRVLRDAWSNKRRVSVLVGPGNNGGDGFVIARYAHEADFDVKVCLLTDKTSGDAALYRKLALAVGVPMTATFTEADLVVDALFGTGLARPLDGKAASWVQAIGDTPVLAVDIPSGINGTTGQVQGVAVKAQRTVTFGTLKLGHLLYPGANHCGIVTVADIGFPRQTVRGNAYLVTGDLVRAWLPARGADAHKGTAGRVLTIGGNSHFSGAPVMASMAVLRIGAGLSTVAVPEPMWTAVAARLQEVMVAPLPAEGDGHLGPSSKVAATELLKASQVAAIGPGLGRHPDSLRLVSDLISDFDGSVVIDADALRGVFKNPTGGGVITPHAGEMATLMGASISDVVSDPLRFAREAAARFGVVAVLKGAHTVISDMDGRVFINYSGNAGMASGGMGDVLTGVIAGLLAQGAAPLEAAVCGVYLHGLAGDLAATDVGLRGLVATDVSARLPGAITRILQGDSLPQPERI